VLKNFLLDWKSQPWHFDAEGSEKDRNPVVFDFTNETTGELEEWSKSSVLPYVNETDGIEMSSVHAHYDPSGGVHYLLGHMDGEPFRLPADGSQVEIKIEYVI
jgi:hypothetical protein